MKVFRYIYGTACRGGSYSVHAGVAHYYSLHAVVALHAGVAQLLCMQGWLI